MEFTIGSDPECFVTDGEDIVSIYGKMPGTKENPYKVTDGAIQVDGFATEFNTEPTPLVKEGEKIFSQSVTKVYNQMRPYLLEHGLAFSPVISKIFTSKFLDAQPEASKELGCDPDYNVWTGLTNTSPPANTRQRVVGGHIHIGWGQGFESNDPEHILTCKEVVKQLDVVVGLSSVLDTPDERVMQEVNRRKQYGKAGSFRIKPYGVEYRTLSNYWVFNPALRDSVYRRCVFAIDQLVSGNFLWENIKLNETVIPRAIDGCKKDSARKLLQEAKVDYIF